MNEIERIDYYKQCKTRVQQHHYTFIPKEQSRTTKFFL